MAEHTETPTIEPATREDVPIIKQVLSQNNLPIHGVANHPEWFVVAYSNNEPIGVGGLEPYRPVGLLRSLAVDESHQGHGIGTAICTNLETRAKQADISTLFLLTLDAAGFFNDRGYTQIQRSAAPSAIQQTAEFSELCPETATCMAKELYPE